MTYRGSGDAADVPPPSSVPTGPTAHAPRSWGEMRRRDVGRCGATLPALSPDDPVHVCALDAGHAGWHRENMMHGPTGFPYPGAEWSDRSEGATPPATRSFSPGLVVNPGDTLVLVMDDADDADADDVARWTEAMREQLPDGARVVFVHGVTPVVVRAGRQCGSEGPTVTGDPGRVYVCDMPAGHGGGHIGRTDTGSASW